MKPPLEMQVLFINFFIFSVGEYVGFGHAKRELMIFLRKLMSIYYYLIVTYGTIRVFFFSFRLTVFFYVAIIIIIFIYIYRETKSLSVI